MSGMIDLKIENRTVVGILPSIENDGKMGRKKGENGGKEGRKWGERREKMLTKRK